MSGEPVYSVSFGKRYEGRWSGIAQGLGKVEESNQDSDPRASVLGGHVLNRIGSPVVSDTIHLL